LDSRTIGAPTFEDQIKAIQEWLGSESAIPRSCLAENDPNLEQDSGVVRRRLVALVRGSLSLVSRHSEQRVPATGQAETDATTTQFEHGT
jgi:hypothetical protein